MDSLNQISNKNCMLKMKNMMLKPLEYLFENSNFSAQASDVINYKEYSSLDNGSTIMSTTLYAIVINHDDECFDIFMPTYSYDLNNKDEVKFKKKVTQNLIKTKTIKPENILSALNYCASVMEDERRGGQPSSYKDFDIRMLESIYNKYGSVIIKSKLFKE